MDQDLDRLNDILRAIAIIEEVAKSGESDFLQSEILQSAILYNFLVIGEAVTYISESLKLAHPEVKWRDIKRFRNLLIHGYMHTNLSIVWGIIQSDLKELREQIEAIVWESTNS
jgi:uncharacterized protein with HEPN domain